MGWVEHDDGQIEFTGWVGRQTRLLTEDDARAVMRVVLIMYIFAVIPSFLIGAGWLPAEGIDTEQVLLQNVPAAAAAALFFVWMLRQPRQRFLRLLPATTVIAFFVAVLSITRGLELAGPEFGVIAIYYVEAPLITFYLLRLRYAIAYMVFMMAMYAIGLSRVDGVVSPFAHWILVLSTAVVSGVLMGGLATRLQEARTQFATFNTRLRRFLAPQVADALADGDAAVAPHRAVIATLFVDLRGFTAFTNASTPERVVEVLDEYYAVVGSAVHDHGGTIGGFDGDGVFAFIGDPVPNENAASDGLTMAKDIAKRLDAHTSAWGLGYGIGLAFGEATVGVVGFEGRVDYTPIGACVNLAARLCGDAKPGEIVIDYALCKAAGVKRPKRRATVDLKGFGTTETFTVSH